MIPNKCTMYTSQKVGKRRIKLSLPADRHSESGIYLEWCHIHIPRGEKWRTPGCGSVPSGIFTGLSARRPCRVGVSLPPVPFVPHLGPLVGFFHKAGGTSDESSLFNIILGTGAPRPPVITLRDSAGQEKEIYAPWVTFYTWTSWQVGDTAVVLRKECS
ncbi:unnamed protein product [Penicillium camemberti]|uniref:Str. FM013 n=1 Tax=Penicillium camemberti (strain FM 013) TaxID=1429867 RepID=A0A0G4P5Q3_PENC3|nr:unnamed protein product [Penicillium camemberti]